MTKIPREEHPRPNMMRDPWLNLNGPWRFTFDPHSIGEPNRWYLNRALGDLSITVPYPWESQLSGVAAPEYKGAGWYQREITVPEEWTGLAPFLHFGAIDWNARVWIDGQFVAENENGYLPFSIDLSRYVQPGQSATLTVRAYDIADAATLVGKQVPFWYTYSSGIWQTVWLEGRQPNHIIDLRMVSNIEQETVEVTTTVQIVEGGHYHLLLSSPKDEFQLEVESVELAPGIHELTQEVRVYNARLWNPPYAYLYDLDVRLSIANERDEAKIDQVHTYFGMREISRGTWEGSEHEYVLFNRKPIYLRGALDQAFHPASLHAYPTDEIIRGDIKLAKEMGLNMLRCHIKINDPRYYYWADKEGVLIMYDMPSPVLDTPAMRRMYEDALRRTISRDYNHPSIFSWVLFNETWGLSQHKTAEGQQWLAKMTHLARELDPTRLIEDNSPCLYDHVESDINSWHFYINDYQETRQHIQRVVDETYPGGTFNYVGGDYVQSAAPLMNSEYGGISARMGDQDISWCFKYQTTQLRRHQKICGYVYTELSDIEWEHNGFVNYDRSRKEFGYDFFVEEMAVADLNGIMFVGMDVPPCQTLPPQSEFAAPYFVSNQSRYKQDEMTVRWFMHFIDRFGEKHSRKGGAMKVFDVKGYSIVETNPLHLLMPDTQGLVTLEMRLWDRSGDVCARNYINIEVREGDLPAVEAASQTTSETLKNGWALRFKPGQFARASDSWSSTRLGPNGAKFAAGGSGWVEYEIVLPPEIELSKAAQLRVIFEAGARAGMAKVDWPQRTYGTNYPQTELDKKYPTDLQVSINGITVGESHIPDDPADARGTLSHYHNHDPGSYGYLTEYVIAGEVLAALQETLADSEEERALTIRFTIPKDADHRGGLSLYGETLGCYPLGPTLVVERT